MILKKKLVKAKDGTAHLSITRATHDILSDLKHKTGHSLTALMEMAAKEFQQNVKIQ